VRIITRECAQFIPTSGRPWIRTLHCQPPGKLCEAASGTNTQGIERSSLDAKKNKLRKVRGTVRMNVQQGDCSIMI